MLSRRLGFSRAQSVTLGLCAFSLVSGGCGGETNPAPDGGPDAGNDTPLYALVVDVLTADYTGQTSYAKFLPSLEAGAKIDESKTIEMTSYITVWGIEKGKEFFGASAESADITKYTINSDGRVDIGGVLSFGAYGVSSWKLPAMFIASKTKAYVFDDQTLQGFVWDPSTMTIISNVKLAEQFHNKDGGKTYAVQPGRAPIQIGAKLYTNFFYYDFATFSTIPGAGLLIIDSEKDTFSVVSHPTCHWLENSELGPDGAIYTVSSASYAAIYRANPTSLPPPCVLRFDPKTDSFDDTFKVNMSDLTGGKMAGGIIGNKDGFAYIKVLNESLFPTQMPPMKALDVSSGLFWETYRINLADFTSGIRVDMSAVSLEIYDSRVDGRVVMGQMNWATRESTLYDMAAVPPAPVTKVDAWLTSVFRVR
jgi:hypothetical protein